MDTTTRPIEEQFAIAQKLQDEGDATNPLFVMSYLMEPAMSMALQSNIRTRTELRTAIVAVAALRFEADRGAFPSTAGEAVPQYMDAVPTDPYGGEPIRYRRLDDGFVVYSLAQNLTDDGGVGGWRNGDITFTVERRNSAP